MYSPNISESNVFGMNFPHPFYNFLYCYNLRAEFNSKIWYYKVIILLCIKNCYFRPNIHIVSICNANRESHRKNLLHCKKKWFKHIIVKNKNTKNSMNSIFVYLQCNSATPNIYFDARELLSTICYFWRLKCWRTLSSITGVFRRKHI